MRHFDYVCTVSPRSLVVRPVVNDQSSKICPEQVTNCSRRTIPQFLHAGHPSPPTLLSTNPILSQKRPARRKTTGNSHYSARNARVRLIGIVETKVRRWVRDLSSVSLRKHRHSRRSPGGIDFSMLATKAFRASRLISHGEFRLSSSSLVVSPTLWALYTGCTAEKKQAMMNINSFVGENMLVI